MYLSFSQKFEIKKPIKKLGKFDWEEVQSSLRPGQRDVPLPIWMKGTIEGTHKSEKIHGTNFEETIIGNSGSDLIYGHDGDDIIYGDHLSWDGEPDSGVDTVYGGNGNDKITAEFSYGENGNDTLRSPLHESAYLNGGKGDDTLWGNSQNDTLIGGSGDDTLRGRDGGDEMTGGLGVDKFVVGYEESFGDLGGRPGQRDVILDFQDPGDHIEIPAITYNGLDRDDVDLEFNRDGALVITVNDPSEGVSGVVAEVHGLDPNQPIDEQIHWINGSTFEMV